MNSKAVIVNPAFEMRAINSVSAAVRFIQVLEQTLLLPLFPAMFKVSIALRPPPGVGQEGVW